MIRSKDLHLAARERTGRARPITSRYTAVYLAVGLVLAVTTMICGLLMEQTDGLGDMEKRTLISTVEMLVILAVQAFIPLWSAGFTCCAMGFARQQNVENRNLLDGLRRWPVLLRLSLLEGLIYLSISYLLMMAVVTVYMMTPAGLQMVLTMSSAVNVTTELTPEMQDALLKTLEPVYLIWLPIVMAISLFLSYQFRLARYRVLDEDRPGAIRALLQSIRMIHRHRWQLVKLDLSWWWFYLLIVPVNGILFLPELLTALHVTLPVNGDIAYLLCYCVYAAALFGLYTLGLAKVETSYAIFYQTLLEPFKAPAEEAQ